MPDSEAPRNVCGTCRFWQFSNEYGGWCRRFPPQLVVLATYDPANSNPEAHRPWTTDNDWCGEHQQKDAG